MEIKYCLKKTKNKKHLLLINLNSDLAFTRFGAMPPYDTEVEKMSVLIVTTTSRDDNLTMATDGSNQTLYNTLCNVLPLPLQ